MTEIPRDRWERPRIWDLTQTPRKLVSYTRTSTVADTTGDGKNLITWASFNAVRGYMLDDSVRAEFAALLSVVPAGQDPYRHHVGSGGKGRLYDLVSKAQDIAGAHKAASRGTAMHQLTEIVDGGGWPSYLEPEQIEPLESYAARMKGIEVVGNEVFGVCDELKIAGTMDKIIWHEGRLRVADLKTGASDPDYPLKVETQVAIYAHSKRYDPATGARFPLGSKLLGDIADAEIDLRTGILIHLPLAGTGCELYPLNLERGWEAAQVAVSMRRLRSGQRSLRKLAA